MPKLTRSDVHASYVEKDWVCDGAFWPILLDDHDNHDRLLRVRD